VEDPIAEEIEPIVSSLGFDLVEVSINRSHRLNHVRVTVHRAGGVSVDDCSRIARLIRPRLEANYPELMLEVSSPGVERVIKSLREYEIFRDRGVRILIGTEPEWIGGTIEGVLNDAVVLRQGGQQRRIPVSAIRKARLDPSQEVEA
jgi:ribosome maturation factor RimP